MNSIPPTAATPARRSFLRRPCTVVLCRGCCCGTERKRPGVDHQGQLERLRQAARESDGRLALLTTDCLGPCSQAKIVVLRPSAAGRRAGGRAVWIGEVLSEERVADILRWAAAGGPGMAPPPATLVEHFIDPPRELWRRDRERR